MGFAGCLLAAMLAVPAPAQDDEEQRRIKVETQVVKSLVAFGRRAESMKLPSRARDVYRIILEHYDEDHKTARRGLGFKKVKGDWEQVTATNKLRQNTGTDRHVRGLELAWQKTAKKAARLHRELGLALNTEGHIVSAFDQLERAIAFDPKDKESHKVLGHEEYDGFFGTDEQVQFVKRMRRIREKAAECAALDLEITPIPQNKMPNALRPSALDFQGAKCGGFTCWIVSGQSEAGEYARWQARAYEFAKWLAKDTNDLTLKSTKHIKYLAVVRTQEQKKLLLTESIDARAGEPIARAMLYGGNSFKDRGVRAEWQHTHRDNDADAAVAHLAKRYFVHACNNAISEGVMHMLTEMMCGSVHSQYMILARTESNGGAEIERAIPAWTKALHQQIAADEDWPLAQLPRERMDNFRTPCRIKAWSFATWLLARHPRTWFRFAAELGRKNQSTEDVAKRFKEWIDQSVGEADMEWREWARAGSAIGEASGL